MSLFMNYSYPGNVRELEHLVERFCLLGGDAENLFRDLPKLPDKPSFDFSYDEILSSTNPLKNARAQAEKDIIIRTLKTCGNDHTQTARNLNISRTYLYEKLKKYSIIP